MNTRYPILLVHGLAMKDTFFMKSFGRIDRILRIQGYTVYTSQIDAVGSVAGNAAQLKAEIEQILRDTGAEKVNLIAHSKGGLDAKWMIEHLGMADKVASLTTLCTPHQGSPVASFVLKFPKFAVKYAAFWVNTFSGCSAIKTRTATPPARNYSAQSIWRRTPPACRACSARAFLPPSAPAKSTPIL